MVLTLSTILVFGVMLLAAAVHTTIVSGQRELDQVDQRIAETSRQNQSLRLEVAELESPGPHRRGRDRRRDGRPRGRHLAGPAGRRRHRPGRRSGGHRPGRRRGRRTSAADERREDAATTRADPTGDRSPTRHRCLRCVPGRAGRVRPAGRGPAGPDPPGRDDPQGAALGPPVRPVHVPRPRPSPRAPPDDAGLGPSPGAGPGGSAVGRARPAHAPPHPAPPAADPAGGVAGAVRGDGGAPGRRPGPPPGPLPRRGRGAADRLAQPPGRSGGPPRPGGPGPRPLGAPAHGLRRPQHHRRPRRGGRASWPRSWRSTGPSSRSR